MCKRESVISTAEKQITTGSPNLVFKNLHHTKTPLETFTENRSDNLCTGTHKRIPMCYGLWMEFLVNVF